MALDGATARQILDREKRRAGNSCVMQGLPAMSGASLAIADHGGSAARRSNSLLGAADVLLLRYGAFLQASTCRPEVSVFFPVAGERPPLSHVSCQQQNNNSALIAMFTCTPDPILARSVQRVQVR